MTDISYLFNDRNSSGCLGLITSHFTDQIMTYTVFRDVIGHVTIELAMMAWSIETVPLSGTFMEMLSVLSFKDFLVMTLFWGVM